MRFFFLCFALGLTAWAEPKVLLMRVPDDGIQPQCETDTAGTVHMIYFKGSASHGDLYYVKRGREDEKFSKPIRVNSQPESALAIGSVRGARLALGSNNVVHVAWMGSDKAIPAF